MFWESIAFNDVTKMRDITCEDVKALQGLAPGISLVDRTEIGKLVRGGALFQEFSQAERECIYEKLVSYKGRIPSLRLFFEDANFLAIGASRIKKLLDPGKCLQSDGKRAVPRTIRETMEYMFERESGDIDIQTSDTSYRQAPCNVEMQFDLAYRQVWLCSLRYSSGRPSKGKKHTMLNADTPPYAQYQVALLASQLGFKSPRISEALRSCPDPEACPWYDFDNDRVPALKRQGIPYVVTFRDDRELLFLDRIHGPLEESHCLPSGFVLRDIYMAFFGGLCDLPPVHDQRGTQGTTGSGFGYAREHNATDNSPQGESGPQQFPEARPSPKTHTTSSNPTCAANSPAEPVDESMLQSPTFPPDTEQPPPPPQSQASVTDPGTSTSTAPNNVEGCETEFGTDTTDGDAPADSMEWTSSVDSLKQQLCDQRGKLLSRKNQIDEFSRTIQKLETVISELRAPESLAGSLVDEVLQETMKSLSCQMTTRRKILKALHLQVQTSLAAIEKQINQLGLLSGKDDQNNAIGMKNFAIIQQAHEIYNSNQSDSPNLDALTIEMETMLGSLCAEFRSLQAFLVASRLGHMTDKLSPCSARISNLLHIATIIWQSHGAPNTDENYASSVNFLQKVQIELGTMQDRLYQQTESMARMDIEVPESQWQDWIKASSELEGSANGMLSTLPDLIAEGENNLQQLYIAAALQEVDAMFEAERITFDALRKRQKLVKAHLTTFERVLTSEVLLDKRLSLEVQDYIDQHLGATKQAVTNALPNLIHKTQATCSTSQKELEEIQALIKQRLKIEAFLDDRKIFTNLQENINKRRNECLSIEGDLLEIERTLTGGMKHTASIMASDMKNLSLEAYKQVNLAAHTQDLSVAKRAVEISQEISGKAAQLLGLVQEIHGLAKNAPDIHGSMGGEIAKAQQAASEACTYVAKVTSAVNQAANACEKQRLCEEATQGYKEVKKLREAWRQRTGTDQTPKECISQMQKAVAKPLNNIRMIQSKLQGTMDTTISATLLQDALKDATTTCNKSTTVALKLFNLVVQSAVKAGKEKRSQIDIAKGLAITAMEAGNFNQQKDHLQNIRLMIQDMRKIIQLAKHAQSAASEHESAVNIAAIEGVITEDGHLSIKETNQGVDMLCQSQAEAESEMKEVESSGWKARAERERQRALDECHEAGVALNKVPEGYAARAEAAAKAYQDAINRLSNAEAAWKTGEKPNSDLVNEFRVISKEAANARGILERLLVLALDADQKAEPMISQTKQMRANQAAAAEQTLEQSCPATQRLVERALMLSKQVTDFYSVCDSGESHSNTSKTEFDRDIDQVKSCVVETHRIYQETRSRAKSHPETAVDALEEIMRASLTATDNGFRFYSTLIKKLAAISKAEIKAQQNLSHRALEDNDKENWQIHQERSQTMVEHMSQDILLGGAAADAIRASFFQHKVGSELSADALHDLNNIAQGVNEIKQIQNEVRSAMAIGWWKARASNNFIRAKNAFEKAETSFRSLNPSLSVDYKHAQSPYILAKKAFKQVRKKWSTCIGPEEEYRKLDEELDYVCNLAVASTKASATVMRRKSAGEKLEGNKCSGGLTNERRPHQDEDEADNTGQNQDENDDYAPGDPGKRIKLRHRRMSQDLECSGEAGDNEATSATGE